MYPDPTLMKKFLIMLLVVAGIFVGYQLVTDSDLNELESESVIDGVTNENSEYELIDGESYKESTEGNLEASMEDGADLSLMDTDDSQYGNKIRFDNSFEHTKPGEYSEIIVNASGFEPGQFTIVYVKKAGTEEYIEAGGKEHTADAEGNISTRFTITEFGEYEVFLSNAGESVVSPVITVN